MMVSGSFKLNNDQLRRYYVGLTRAKKNLFIYTGSSCFDGGPSSVEYRFDSGEYDMPGEVVLQLTHKDVVLSYFISRKKAVLALKGGDRLDYADGYLYPHGMQKTVAKLSAKMLERMTLWQSKGYTVHSASVRFIVARKAKDAPKEETETAVLLPELTLRKTR